MIPIAFLAIKFHTDVLASPFFRCNPFPDHPWWIMTHMLSVAANKIRHPVASFILMEPDYFTKHITFNFGDPVAVDFRSKRYG